MDDLYEVFDANKHTPVKYFLIYNPLKGTSSDMTIQQKIFRKFFYENSSYIDDQTVFIELTNQRVAQRLGVNSQDTIMAIQNKNPFNSIGEPFKLMNLDLEKLTCDSMKDENLERRYAKYLSEFTKKEFDDFLMSEDNIDYIFEQLASFVEDVVVNRS